MRRSADDGTGSGCSKPAELEQATPPSPIRREWGAERPRPPLPAVAEPATTLQTWLGGTAIAATVVAWVVFLGRTIAAALANDPATPMPPLRQTVFYVLLMSLLTFSALMYLCARQGAFYRSRDSQRVPRATLDAHFGRSESAITVLIPSYAEDPAVVRATVLSAVLQEFPDLRVVLLIDDPPHPTDPAAVQSLQGCRELAAQVNEMLREPRQRFALKQADFRLLDPYHLASREQIAHVAHEYRWAARWLCGLAADYPVVTTADEFLVDEVLRARASDFDTTARALAAALEESAPITSQRLRQLRRSLSWTFAGDISSFERKQYLSLSHEANKAMNLNAYLGMMGRTYVVVDTPAGKVLQDRRLRPDLDGQELHVPDSEFVLTLDADSILLPDYCLRLVYLMQEQGNERIAVAQTPYSAFRGAHTRLERMAGATTDIQHVVHQGLTYFNATFWVGANAVIRKEALDDIEEIDFEHGREIHRYIQDRTVIEDTESSIDLVDQGWSLFNYNERLSYSATPPDFGSLVIQRARWANGGLLIIPKFWRYMRSRRREGRRVLRSEIAMRFNYMASIAWASVGLVALLLIPFSSSLLSPVIFLAALPYFLALAVDVRRLGYKRSDVFRMYGFNLILLPVNLAGAFKSLQQAASKTKIPFARTPKVNNRTAAPALYIMAAYAIAVFSLFTFARQVVLGNSTNAAFAALNSVLTFYAIVAFIGIRNSIVDVAVGAAQWVRVPTKAAKQSREDRVRQEQEALDWEAVLYFGPGDGRAGRLVAHGLGLGAPVTAPPDNEDLTLAETLGRREAG